MLYPMFAMVVLIYGFMLYTLTLRIQSVISGNLNLSYFKVFSGNAPENIIKSNRHFSNLFETPVLFFAAGILCIIFRLETPLVLTAGWLYVFSRLAHMYIHMTYNRVIHRMAAFLISCVCIFIIWCAILAQQLSNPSYL